MKFSEDFCSGGNAIQSYHENGVQINGRIFEQSLVVSHDKLINDWPVKCLDDLSKALLQDLIDQEPEVILIGTGERIRFPHPELQAHVANQGVGIEFMDTGAACRTYNVLLSEQRRVVAGIII